MAATSPQSPTPPQPSSSPPDAALHPSFAYATFGGGCFWCLEPPYDSLPGVLATEAGYTGGHVPNPSYEQVCQGTTGHAEAVRIRFDPSRISYRTLLATFWRNIDPTAKNRQFHDVGTQYRTAIFWHDEEQKRQAEENRSELQASGRFAAPIATTLEKADIFYPAEDYHQDYYLKCPLRYKSYKQGSGRDAFLNRHWGESQALSP